MTVIIDYSNHFPRTTEGLEDSHFLQFKGSSTEGLEDSHYWQIKGSTTATTVYRAPGKMINN